MISFKELAQSVSKNYRDCDDDTRDFCNEIADTLGDYFKKVEQVENKKKKGKDGMKEEVEGKKKKKLKRRKDADTGVASSSSLTGAKKSKTGSTHPHFELSQAEALTVQQLMGMKAHSPPTVAAMSRGSAPPTAMYRYPPASLSAYAQGAAASRGGHSSTLSRPVHHPMHAPAMQAARQPKAVSSQPTSSPPLQDTETMILEMAQAIQVRQESERRIELLQRRLVTSSAAEEPPVRYSYPRPEYAQNHHHHQRAPAPARQSLEPTEEQIAEYSYARYLVELRARQAAASAVTAAESSASTDREQLLMDAYLRFASSY